MVRILGCVAGAALLFVATIIDADARGGGRGGRGGARVYYSGSHHTTSHGGHYVGAVGSSHKGGHYVNALTGNRYGIHSGSVGAPLSLSPPGR